MRRLTGRKTPRYLALPLDGRSSWRGHSTTMAQGRIHTVPVAGEAPPRLTEVLAPLFRMDLVTPPGRLVADSGWLEHVPFAHYLIGALRPSVLVELGTFSGTSYCAFCEAVLAHRT